MRSVAGPNHSEAHGRSDRDSSAHSTGQLNAQKSMARYLQSSTIDVCANGLIGL
jgi:hypothetical protein